MQVINVTVDFVLQYTHFSQTDYEWRDIKMAFYQQHGFPHAQLHIAGFTVTQEEGCLLQCYSLIF